MAQDQFCSKCKSKLSSDITPDGLCPQCLLKLGLESEANEFDQGAWFQALEPEEGKPDIPESIGPYRILEVLGEGGMGIVCLAEQREPIRRRVALKVIKLGMDTKQVIARFESERQVLALMNHPNIAKVLDAGSTEQGRPYFVMEYVAGVPITEYCDKHRLNTRERLEMFTQVCEAIQHAHQKGIIHRDIKPSNVLVETEDVKPVPKVIDFGVAKATHQRLTEKTLFTRHGVMVGTPAYMSPEQVEMRTLDIDTRTDIYSLGVMLYELLAGAPPFDPKSLREAGVEAVNRMISEVEPPKPSLRYSSLGDEATTVAQRRRTEPAVLERQIRGELDWITMYAMDKDATRRYRSASEFEADIQRYLSNEPVVAGPPDFFYRMRKFARRNKTGVSLSAVAIFVLINFAVAMTIQANRIARERDHAQLEADRSQGEATILQAILLDDVSYLGESSSENIAQRVRNVWDLHRKSSDKDAVLARYAVNLLSILDLAVTFDNGDKTVGFEVLEELELDAVRLIRRALAAGDTSIFETVDLMIAYLEKAHREPGKQTIALQFRRSSITLRRKTRPPGDPLLVQDLEKFAQYLENKGRQALAENRSSEAEAIFRELLGVRREIHPVGSIWTYFPAIAKGFLGESLTKLNRHAEAEPLLLDSLEVLDTRDSRLRLINLYESWGKSAKADQYRKDLWIESVRELGPIGTPEVNNMQGGTSCLFADRSVWVFNDWFVRSEVPAGRTQRQNRWAWTDDLNASDGIRLYEPAIKPNRNRELLPLTHDEQAFNNAQIERWVLWPESVIADIEHDRALVIYTKVLAEPNSSRRDHVGYSIAVWPHTNEAVVRPILRPNSEYPTMLFQENEPHFGMGAVVDSGFLYLYASSCQGLDCGSIVARSPLSQVLDRSAWRFYSGEGTWVRDWQLAARVLTGARDLSVHWNKYLKKYLAVYTPAPFGNGIAIQTADRLEGPWSSGRLILEGIRPADGHYNIQARAHPEFALDNGRIEYVTYIHPTGDFTSEVRLVEMTFK